MFERFPKQLLSKRIVCLVDQLKIKLNQIIPTLTRVNPLNALVRVHRNMLRKNFIFWRVSEIKKKKIEHTMNYIT